MTKQRGWIGIPTGSLEIIFGLAVIGLIAFIGAVGYGLFWLLTHVRFA
jgi:ABC-type phosphate transport system auxiliary subunit